MKALIFFLAGLALTATAAQKPNFLLVYIDDLGWSDTSLEMYEGVAETRSDFYQTPHLERLAREGMVFSDAYAPAPVCTPSRNAMLHGMTPARMLNTTLDTSRSKAEYRGQITIPQAIKQADPNYITAHFGKWHIGSIRPDEAGFDVTENMKGTGNGEGDYMDDMKTHLPDEDPKRILSITKMSKDFISQQVEADRPFFLQLSHYSVHIWHDSLKETREKYRALPRPQKAVDSDYLPEEQIPDFKHNWLLNYAAMIDDTDRAFGDLLDHLEMLGIADNTYVIFTSDNGGGLRGNKPLRGAKADLTEGGIRIPFVVRGPNIPHGKYCDIPTAGWDILPTFYELAGGKKSLPADLDGVSLADAFKQGNAATIKRPNDALIFHFPWYNGEPESAIRIGQYKLLKNIDTGVSALYDLKNDYAESNDLSAQFPKVKASMEGKLTSYLSSVKAETVNELRVEFLGNIENSWLRNAKQRAEKHRTAAENGDPKAIEELAKALKHVKWLHEQVIFTRERMKMKNYAN
jgi:arylsulfatase A-like enzyme